MEEGFVRALTDEEHAALARAREECGEDSVWPPAMLYAELGTAIRPKRALFCDIVRGPSAHRFRHFFAPYVKGVPPVARMLRDGCPDPFFFAAYGVESAVPDSDTFDRLRELQRWGWVPSDPVAAIFSFVCLPLCFEFMISWLGHHLVPNAAAKFHQGHRSTVLFPRRQPVTVVRVLRYIANDPQGHFPPGSRQAALEFLAAHARMEHSRLVLLRMLRKRYGWPGMGGVQALTHGVDWTMLKADKWNDRFSCCSDLSGPTLWKLRNLDDIPVYCREYEENRAVKSKRLFH